MGGISGSYIVGAGGLPWLHWTNVILSSVSFALCFFFQPETLFDRGAAMLRSTTGPMESDDKTGVQFVETLAPHPFAPYNFRRSLKIGTYRPGFLRMLASPWKALRLPGTWLVMLWYGGLVGGIVTASTVAPTIMASPPYLWGQNVGLASIGGLVGTILGGAVTILLVDRMTKWGARKETHGYAEPEGRLILALPGVLLAAGGLLIFGFCAGHPQGQNWIGMQFGIGLLGFGLTQVPSVGFSYVSTYDTSTKLIIP